jgi:hypothetical protein
MVSYCMEHGPACVILYGVGIADIFIEAQSHRAIEITLQKVIVTLGVLPSARATHDRTRRSKWRHHQRGHAGQRATIGSAPIRV